MRAGVRPGLRARPGWGRGGGGQGVRAGEERGREGGRESPSPAALAGALPRHVPTRSGADVFCLGERELSRRALLLAGAANLPSRPRGGAAPDERLEQPLQGRDWLGRAGLQSTTANGLGGGGDARFMFG